MDHRVIELNIRMNQINMFFDAKNNNFSVKTLILKGAEIIVNLEEHWKCTLVFELYYVYVINFILFLNKTWKTI